MLDEQQMVHVRPCSSTMIERKLCRYLDRAIVSVRWLWPTRGAIVIPNCPKSLMGITPLSICFFISATALSSTQRQRNSASVNLP